LQKRNHDDKGKEQAAIFEIGKDAIRTTLISLQVRTGKKSRVKMMKRERLETNKRSWTGPAYNSTSRPC